MIWCARWIVAGSEEPVAARAVRIEAVSNHAKAPGNNGEPSEEQATRMSRIKDCQRNETSTENNCCGNRDCQVDYPGTAYLARNPDEADSQAKNPSNNPEPRQDRARVLQTARRFHLCTFL